MKKNLLNLFQGILLSVLFLTFPIADGAAQSTSAQQQNEATAQQEEPPIRLESPYQPFEQSLFFTEDELLRIRVALAGVSGDVVPDDGAKQPPRIIRLSGIAYSNPGDWTVWLNGVRLTPEKSLPEIVSMNVRETYIDLKWFDYGLRKIIKIRLRPNQVYDIATGILLPG